MKHVQSYAAAFLALILIGCGGGGGSNPDPNPSLSTPHIEAIVRVERASLQHPGQFTDAQLLDPTNQDVYNDLLPSAKTVFGIQDALNLQVGEHYVFQLVSYDENGRRVTYPASFSSSDAGNVYGNIAENSGSFDASQSATADNQTVFASYNGENYQAQYAVRPRQTRLLGRILRADSGAPLAGVQINFYAPNGLYVGTVTSASDGTYRASIPTSAIEFSVVGNTLPLEDYRVFTYSGFTYEASNADCRAPLPGLAQGTQSLVDIFITPKSQDEPGLSGCSAG